MEDTPNRDDATMWQRIKDSPRTVSALIIILIIAAGIYAFSDNTPSDGTPVPVQEEAVSEVDNESDEPAASPGTTPTESSPEATAGAQTGAATPLPEPSRTDAGYVEVAQSGEGITHLARRSANQWLGENKTDYEVTNAHKVYIEDYIQNQLGNEGLNLGETRTVSFDLIAEAVGSAKNLSESQLQNLNQYTHALP